MALNFVLSFKCASLELLESRCMSEKMFGIISPPRDLLPSMIIIIVIIKRMRRSHRHPQGSESQTKQKSVSQLGIEPRSSD